MSLHKSLKRRDHLSRRRNVLSRTERIERLKEEEKWDEGKTSVFGLPKVKVEVIAAPAARPRAVEKAEGAEAPAEGQAGDTPAPGPKTRGTPGAAPKTAEGRK